MPSSSASFLDALSKNDALNVTVETFDTAKTIVWVMKSIAVVASTCLLITTAKLLKSNAHYDALWTMVGAVIAGISPNIVQVFFLS